MTGEDGNGNGNGNGNGKATPAQLSAWHILALSLVLAALIVALLVVFAEYDSAQDSIGVLGVVVPAIATIGAAIFGVAVGYNVGQNQGEKAGKQEGAAEAKKKIGNALMGDVESLREQLNTALLEPITTNFESASGRAELTVPTDAQQQRSIRFANSDIEGVRDQLGALEHKVKALATGL